MKNMWRMALAATAVIGTASVAQADTVWVSPQVDGNYSQKSSKKSMKSTTNLTLNGQTGLFFSPTAEIVESKKPQVQIDYQHVDVADDNANMYGIGGAIQITKGVELSANYNRGSFLDGHANNWRIGGKYQILNQQDHSFALAVGGSYEDYGISGPSDLTHYGFYAAATKGFTAGYSQAPIKATVGVRWDHIKLDVPFLLSGSDSKTSFYAGASIPVTSDGQFSLVGEINSKILDGGKTPYSLGLRYHPRNTNFNASIGLGRTNLFELFPGTDTGYFAQVGYTFGD